MERRLESAARLVGYAEQVTATAWMMPRFEHLQRCRPCGVGCEIDQVRLEALYAEGAKLEPEAVCRLTLGASRLPAAVGVVARSRCD